MMLSIRILGNGERVPFLLGEDGLPLFYPILFETARLRNGGAALNTIRNKLGDIEVLLRWEAANNRDLVVEFGSGRMLTVPDISSLRDFCGLDMRHLDDSGRRGRFNRNVTPIEALTTATTTSPRVSQTQQYNRLSTIAEYVEFIASVATQHRGSGGDVAAIAKMVRRVREHRPRGRSGYGDDDPNAKSPAPAVIKHFMEAMAVDSPENPFANHGVKLRNAIVFGLLRWTGMRRGELLSLRIDQLDLGEKPQVWVRRSQDDRNDPRPNQPVAKTKERPLPIPDDLAEQIEDYILNVRAKIGPARSHPYLLVSHRKGGTFGKPLSTSALSNRIMGTARSVAPEFTRLHPHAFRHYFNYELSAKIDAHNVEARAHPEDSTLNLITEAQELDMRAFLNGHRSVTSGRVYTRRHVREQADRAVRTIQAEIIRK